MYLGKGGRVAYAFLVLNENYFQPILGLLAVNVTFAAVFLIVEYEISHVM